MESQQRDLEQRLAGNGWRVVDREREPDWWLDELWSVESDWRPRGLRLWISFLVDPAYSGERRKGEGVWAVALTAYRPAERLAAEPTYVIRRHWSESMDEILATAQRLRDGVATNDHED